jgi:hypothetical protein
MRLLSKRSTTMVSAPAFVIVVELSSQRARVTGRVRLRRTRVGLVGRVDDRHLSHAAAHPGSLTHAFKTYGIHSCTHAPFRAAQRRGVYG